MKEGLNIFFKLIGMVVVVFSVFIACVAIYGSVARAYHDQKLYNTHFIKLLDKQKEYSMKLKELEESKWLFEQHVINWRINHPDTNLSRS